jgi:hypothetical protein
MTMTTKKAIDSDRRELIELDALLMNLPDEIILAYARADGKQATAQFRFRMGAAIKAALGMLDAVEKAPIGRTRTECFIVLEDWRTDRARVAERLGRPEPVTGAQFRDELGMPADREFRREVHGEFLPPVQSSIRPTTGHTFTRPCGCTVPAGDPCPHFVRGSR